jgi:uncharacterized membrane protein YkoI
MARMALNRCLVLGTLCLLLAGAAWPAGTAHAQGHGRGGAERPFADQGISLDEAVARAERRYKARAVKAEEKRHGDRIEYRIRLLGDDGRVFEVRVDAATGRER